MSDKISNSKIILYVLDEVSDFVPKYSLMKTETKWGWLGIAAERRCREMEEKKWIEVEYREGVAHYRITQLGRDILNKPQIAPSEARPERVILNWPRNTIASRVWIFTSDHDPNIKYKVCDFTIFYTCTCPFYENRHRNCKHIERAKREPEVNMAQLEAGPKQAQLFS